jgi:hypothetical protein
MRSRRNSPIGNGELRFRGRKLAGQDQESICNQSVEPDLVKPDDSGNWGAFWGAGSGSAAELSRTFPHY